MLMVQLGLLFRETRHTHTNSFPLCLFLFVCKLCCLMLVCPRPRGTNTNLLIIGTYSPEKHWWVELLRRKWMF